jgi:methylated-DNA-[protein]-cysteine S-methyltransferase
VHAAAFDTDLGRCRIEWTDSGVSRFLLPGDRVNEGPNDPPPPHIAQIIDRIRAHLAGRPQSFADVALDLTGVPPFHKKLYGLLREVEAGQTITYRDLASRAESPEAVRAVGRAMAANPIPLIVPCHRVLGARDEAVGFSAPGGVHTKARLLQLEGVHRIDRELQLDLFPS